MATVQELRSLEVILTAGCNLRCSYCYQNDKKGRSIEWEPLRASLDLLVQSREQHVTVLFIGGEPLLEFPLMTRAVAYVEAMRRPDMRVKYSLVTNGMLVTDEHIEFFARRDFDVQLSFDGIPIVQDLRGRGTFERLDRILDRLHERYPEFFGMNFSISQTLLPSTLRWFADSVAYFLGKGVQELRISPAITATPDWRVDRIAELDRAFDAAFAISVRHYRRTGRVPLAVFRGGAEPPKWPGEVPMCAVANADKLAVDVDGHLLGCVTFAPSYQTFPTRFLRSRMEALRIGEILESSLADRIAHYGDVVRATGLFHDKRTKYSSYGKCADCRYLHSCAFCPVSIGNQPGNEDPDRVPDFLCAYNLISQKYRERFPRMSARAEILANLVPLPELPDQVAALLTKRLELV